MDEKCFFFFYWTERNVVIWNSLKNCALRISFYMWQIRQKSIFELNTHKHRHNTHLEQNKTKNYINALTHRNKQWTRQLIMKLTRLRRQIKSIFYSYLMHNILNLDMKIHNIRRDFWTLILNYSNNKNLQTKN